MDVRSLAIIVLCVSFTATALCVSPAPRPEGNMTPPHSGVVSGAAPPRVTGYADITGFVSDAVIYTQRVGKDRALSEFADRNGSFTKGERYIWAYDFNGTNLAHPYHPEYTGQNKLGLSDASGVRMIAAMQEKAWNGSGFVTYQFDNPVTGKTEQKLAYVKRVDDTWWIGSGVYGPDLFIPDTSPEIVRDVLQARTGYAAEYARAVGKEKALMAFNNASGPFIMNGSYIFAFDMNGTTLAMPFAHDLIGKNEGNLTDRNGVSIGERKRTLARAGGGHFYYVYKNPASGKNEFKVSYVEPVDQEWAVGAGVYLPDIRAEYPAERREKLIATVKSAVSFLDEVGPAQAISEFNNPNGSFSNPEMFIFVFDQNGTLLANPFLPGIVGHDRSLDRDPYGEYPVPYIISNGKSGGGFMYYFFADPADEFRIRLKLAYSERVGNDMVVGSGIFP